MNPSMIEVAESVLELDKLADPGPWNTDEYHDILNGNGCVSFENSSANDWDAGFIAYTRTAAPDLAREVITVHAELAQAREALRQIKELAKYDLDHEEDGNTYQIEAIASATLKENE